MAKQPFDEDKNRPGIQAMPTVTNGSGGARYAPEDPRSRGGAPGTQANAQLADMLRRYVDAQSQLTEARRRTAIEEESGVGSPSSRHLARRREQKLEASVAEMRKALSAPAQQQPATPVEAPKPPDPVVTVPTTPTAPATGMPTPPSAVTDPASEISAEEQNARLRARILLMNAGTRAGRLIQTTNSQLGYRGLTGL